ncbi:MAG: hypothetical protein IKW00_02820 [Clostridia bacterium]|nr:hypothetical protein [Clostridia bacterium]
MPDYFIALDVGGTKSDGVLFTPDGHILRHIITPGANPLDLGFDAAMERYLQSIRLLLSKDVSRVKGMYAGIAAAMYLGDKLPHALRPLIPADRLRIETDGPALISAMLGHRDGASLICGTGSSLTIRKGDQYDMIGGWGYLIDGCASGFILGKRAVLAAVREHDGRGEKTLITKLLHDRIGEPVADHIETLYSRGRPYIASFAGVIFDALRQGDPVAEKIVRECIADLAELVLTAYRRLGGAYTLVLNGGIFQAFPEYVQLLKDSVPKDVEMIDSDAPPVFGCAVECLWDAGIDLTPSFKKTFMEDYRTLPVLRYKG